MIGWLLCKLDEHDWDAPRVVHALVFPSAIAMTVPVRERSCKRKGCTAFTQERV